MNYKKLKDWNSGFVEAILRRHPKTKKDQNGFMGGTISGGRGTGKSTYAYKVLAKTYYELNGYTKVDEEEDAYKEALKYFIFEPEVFLKLALKNKVRREVTPAICLDDASMHFGRYLYLTKPRLCAAIQAETATIRTAVTGLLITVPSRFHLVKFLREYDDFKGVVRMINGAGGGNWHRKIRFYKWNYYPDEKKYRIQIPFQDIYSCFIPEPYYTWYVEKKRTAEIRHTLESFTLFPELHGYAEQFAPDMPEELQKEFFDDKQQK